MPFETEGLAGGVAGALGVDKGLPPNVVRKTVTAEVKIADCGVVG